MKVFVFAHPVIDDFNGLGIETCDKVIACDGALFHLDKQNIKIHMSIGDFDSLEDKTLLEKYPHVTLNREKDETDSMVAIKYAYTLSDEVYLVGGIGGERFEHSIANINLLNLFQRLTIVTDKSKMFVLNEGEHILSFDGYISIFPYNSAIITLKGFKYPLNLYELNEFDSVGISNEIIAERGKINITKGRVLVILTKSRSNM